MKCPGAALITANLPRSSGGAGASITDDPPPSPDPDDPRQGELDPVGTVRLRDRLPRRSCGGARGRRGRAGRWSASATQVTRQARGEQARVTGRDHVLVLGVSRPSARPMAFSWPRRGSSFKPDAAPLLDHAELVARRAVGTAGSETGGRLCSWLSSLNGSDGVWEGEWKTAGTVAHPSR